MHRLIVLFLLLLAVPTAWSECTGELTAVADGDYVTFNGVIVPETFQKPPGYTSNVGGDQPLTYWVLHLDKPLCIVGVSPIDGEKYQIGDVDRLQLILQKEVYESNHDRISDVVEVKGVLVQAISAWHFTKALIDVEELTFSPVMMKRSDGSLSYPDHIKIQERSKPYVGNAHYSELSNEGRVSNEKKQINDPAALGRFLREMNNPPQQYKREEEEKRSGTAHEIAKRCSEFDLDPQKSPLTYSYCSHHFRRTIEVAETTTNCHGKGVDTYFLIREKLQSLWFFERRSFLAVVESVLKEHGSCGQGR